MERQPKTLGEKLATTGPGAPGSGLKAWLWSTLYTVLNLTLLAALIALPVWWLLKRPDIDPKIIFALLAVLSAIWVFVYLKALAHRGQRASKSHYLLANDRQGFMRDLRLDAKTAIIDGSNIYHFGHDNKLDAQPLGEIAHDLRTEGYRIICFFDANIFHTLNEHGAYSRAERHSSKLLQDIFGLELDEIYVVPSGVQADKFILETLKHLPISFAVTNDLFRDYAKAYPSVMKDSQWRKGVEISDGAVKLRNLTFKTKHS